MTLKDFCEQYKFQLTRTGRTIRNRVLEETFGTTDVADKQLRDQEIWFRIPSAGFEVNKPEGHKRMQYEIFDAETFADWLHRQSGGGIDYLTKRDKEFLFKAGRIMAQAEHVITTDGRQIDVPDNVRKGLREIIERAR